MDTPASYSALRQALTAGQTSVLEQVDTFLRRIEEHQALNAFVEVFEDCREHAREVDQRIQAGKAGRLAGMVIALKDVLVYRGHKVRAASRILGDFESLFTATALERLLREDAVFIGSTNCDEFAMGSSNENSAFGPVKNPIDPTRVPGGSSGGAAAALKAGLCHVALGTDTGGSVRQPASFCDVVGLKPTYGLVSRYGLIAYASSFDQIGTFTHHLEDAGLLLDVMAGHDPLDNTTATRPKPEGLSPLASPPPHQRIAILDFVQETDAMDPEIQRFLRQLAENLQADGHQVETVPFPYHEQLMAAYYVLTTAEASSNLARYDGVRYGRRAEGIQSTEELYTRSRSEGFGPEVKRRIMLGTFVLSAGYYDAYYQKAQKIRRLIYERTRDIFRDYDFILSPATPTPPFELGEKTQDPVSMYLSDLLTVQANLAGIPAISLPLGQHSSGLPFGIQLQAARFDEPRLLAFADHLLTQHRTQPQQA